MQREPARPPLRARRRVERENPAPRARAVRPERKIVAAHSLHEDGVGRADLHGQVGSVETEVM